MLVFNTVDRDWRDMLFDHRINHQARACGSLDVNVVLGYRPISAEFIIIKSFTSMKPFHEIVTDIEMAFAELFDAHESGAIRGLHLQIGVSNVTIPV